jgi:hypothetical protein
LIPKAAKEKKILPVRMKSQLLSEDGKEGRQGGKKNKRKRENQEPNTFLLPIGFQ